MEAAAERGVYDDRRSVVRDGDHTQVPVTSKVEINGYRVIIQSDPVWRKRGLDDLVGFEAPSSWRIVGEVILVGLRGYSDSEKESIGEALLELHPECKAVLDYRGVHGVTREPETELVVGSDTLTIHRENGYRYRLDPRSIMFSVGNRGERRRMERVVDSNETVYDMFAGIGYFTIPLAKGGAEVVAAEINTEAYDYLIENTRLNGVGDRVRAFNQDCRSLYPTATRVVMGHFESEEYLGHALNCLEEGWLHIHTLSRSEEMSRKRLEEAVLMEDICVEQLGSRVVKSYSAGYSHAVVDMYIC